MRTYLVRIVVVIIVFLNITGCTALQLPAGYKPIDSSQNQQIYRRYDEFKNVSFYKHKAFWSLLPTPIEVYVGEDDSKYMRLIFRYKGSDWIFFDNTTVINSEGDKMSFSFETYDKTTDVGYGGYVTESIDLSLSRSRAIELLDLVTTNGEVKVRMSGEYYRDYIISKNQVEAIRQMINYYLKN